MKFGIENAVISSYKRLSYEPWYAFAEFVDNSTQAYFDHKSILDETFANNGTHLTIDILYNRDGDFIQIEDNSIGMDETELDRALKVGLPPENPTQRSKYGLGMKTAACWFGNKWSIETKKINESFAYKVDIDVDAIAKEIGEVDLPAQKINSTKDAHYTRIIIKDLNRKFVGRTITKIKEYLGSIYRFDIDSGIEINWNGAKLFYKRFEDELFIDEKGEKYKKRFEFQINNKDINGWVGVLGKGYGSRKKAGFSIIQNKRVIQGWPNSYKPSSIFGEQEDGSNDLVNQRVVGELILDGFAVSHTKDKIVWESDEEEQLDKKLGEVCAEARELALTIRYNTNEQKDRRADYLIEAMAIIIRELNSSELKKYLSTEQAFPEKIIKSSFDQITERVIAGSKANVEIHIEENNNVLNLFVFFNSISELDPHVLISVKSTSELYIIINILHPIIQYAESSESILQIFREHIYDGIAEWKTLKTSGTLSPFTFKSIKDGLLRIPAEIASKEKG